MDGGSLNRRARDRPCRKERWARVFNLLCPDRNGARRNLPTLSLADPHRPHHRFDKLAPKNEVFETGIKVVDLLHPFVRVAKIGASSVGAGLRQDGDPHRLIARIAGSQRLSRVRGVGDEPRKGMTSGLESRYQYRPSSRRSIDSTVMCLAR